MAVEKRKRKLWQTLCAFLNGYQPQTQLSKIDNSLDLSRSYGSLLENQKTRASRKLILPENDIQTSLTVTFPKKHLGFRNLETN